MKTLLFDLDGTLIDSQEDLANAVNHALDAIGKPAMERPDIICHVGNGLRYLLENTVGAVSPDVFKEAKAAFESHYHKNCVVNTVLYDGVLDSIKAWHGKTRMGVVTNKPRGFSELILDRLGVAPYLDVIVGGDSLSEKKPHPAPLLNAMNTMAGKKAETVMIGDSVQDIKAGQNAGVQTCAARYGYGFNASVEELQPDYGVNKFSDLKEILL